MPRRSELVMEKVVGRVVDMYHNQNMTQKDIAAQLCSEGYQTSKSAVGRVIKQHTQYLKEIEAARKEAEAIILATAKTPGTDISDATLQITITKLLGELKSFENFGGMEAEEIINAIAKVSRAQGYIAKVKLDYEKGYKAGLFDAAKRLGEEAKRLGLSDSVVLELKEKVLGLKR